jgi:hypothetical protein
LRGVNNALAMSEVEFFIQDADLFINRTSLFSHLFFVLLEMKIADMKKIEAFYLRWDESRNKNRG